MQNDKKYTVLFVCSSNVCRSPYCEFMLRRMVENDDDLRGKVDVCSSAVFNRSKSIFPKAVDILKREGFDESEILAHKPSFKTDKERFEKADVIIGMSHTHKLLTTRKVSQKIRYAVRSGGGKVRSRPRSVFGNVAKRVRQDYASFEGIRNEIFYKAQSANRKSKSMNFRQQKFAFVRKKNRYSVFEKNL